MSLRAWARQLGAWGRRSVHGFLFHNDDYLHEELLVTSYFVPQAALGISRAVIFTYCLAVLVANLTVNIVHGAGWSWAAYFTTLTFCGITAYYGLAAYNTLRYTTAQRLWQWRWQWQWRKKGVSEMPISAPMPLSREQMAMLANDSRVGMPVELGGSTPSIDTMGRSPEECGASAIERVQLLQSGYRREPMALRDVEPCAEITELVDEQQDDYGGPGEASYGEETKAQSASADCYSEWPEAALALAPEMTPAPQMSLVHRVSLATQWVLYEMFVCFAPLVTLIYWCLLYPTQDLLDGTLDVWMGVSMHAVNSVLMVLEIAVFARTRCRWTHFTAMVLVLVLYLGLVYFMVGVYDFYVYPFFETHYFGKYVAIVCLLIVDIVGIIWVVMLMVHRCRDLVYTKWLSRRRTAFAL
ncbi:hypothetical protein GGI07_005455 [Coemansia sp. Benny D115]|nr:hypothetical protein GGI07_005455 [Coemansia sp. Benny D115]